MQEPPKLVIFDCDGVLVDSEPTSNRVLHDLLVSYGASLTYDESYSAFVGKNRFAVEKYMREQNLTLPSNWSEIFYETSIAELSDTVQAIEGVEQILRTLANRSIPFCVASNGTHAKMLATLTASNLLPYVKDNRYSGYDMPRGKPAPDLFLHAAAAHNTAAKDCVVIEDSASGFQAAQSAGMPCFAYNPRPDTPLFGAIPFTTMSELPKHLNLMA